MKQFFGVDFSLGSLFTMDLAVDIETSGLDKSDSIVSIGFANRLGGVVYVLSGDSKLEDEVSCLLQFTLLNHCFEHTIIFHNAFFDLPFIVRKFFPHQSMTSLQFAKKLADTLIMARFIYSTQYLSHLDLHGRLTYSLKFLVEYYGISVDEAYSFEETVKGIKIQYLHPLEIANYNYQDCENTLALYAKFRIILSQDGGLLYYEDFHFPHAFWNIFHMRSRGIPVNKELLDEKLLLFEHFIEDVSYQVFLLTKKSFNFASANEVKMAIFFNESLTHRDGEILLPPFVTDKKSVKVDIDTFKYLRDNADLKENSNLFNLIISIIEASSTLKELKAIQDNLESVGSNIFLLFPNQSVSAKSGRIRMSKPNVHGQSKRSFKITRWD